MASHRDELFVCYKIITIIIDKNYACYIPPPYIYAMMASRVGMKKICTWRNNEQLSDISKIIPAFFARFFIYFWHRKSGGGGGAVCHLFKSHLFLIHC